MVAYPQLTNGIPTMLYGFSYHPAILPISIAGSIGPNDSAVWMSTNWAWQAGFAGDWPAVAMDSGSLFQVAPSVANADSMRTQTPHPGGMQVALADGSVRSLSPGLSGTTWWAACTPAGGEVLGSDW
jgi:prepilin-type processing-associated H-X9-DG protein